MKLPITTLFVLISLGLKSQGDLAYYISTAQKNSPLITDNQNQSQANQLEAERLKAFYTKAQIGLTANYLFAPIINLDGSSPKFEANTKGASDYRGYDLAVSNSGQYQALLNITQPLFNAQKAKVAGEQVLVNGQINQNQIRLTGHDLEKVVGDQYILCLQDIRQMDYAEAMLGILNEQKSVVQKLVGSSIYKQSDLSLLNIETGNFELQLAGFKATYKRDLMDLNILCGLNDTTVIRLKEPDLQVRALAPTSFYNEKYHLDSLAILATKDIFNLKYRPQFSIFANTGLNAVYAPTIPNRFGANAGFSFSYYFFDGRQKKNVKAKTDVLLKTVAAYKENLAVVNAARKTKILNELQSYDQRLILSGRQLQEYQTLMGLYKKEIMTGQLSIINYLTTLKTWPPSNVTRFAEGPTTFINQRLQLLELVAFGVHATNHE